MIDLYGAYDLANSAYISIKVQNSTIKGGYILKISKRSRKTLSE